MVAVIKSSILEVQPASCRAPLPIKVIEWSDWHREQKGLVEKIERVLSFDPTKLYKRIHPLIDPYKRHAGLVMEQLFPQPPRENGKCTCGCRKKPKKYSGDQYYKWATDSCSGFAGDVLSIINNYFGAPAKYINWYYGHVCSECPCTTDLELDHIIGVKHGGGGAWLSNYRWLCRKCHRNKTNKDFGFKKPSSQLLLI